MTLRYLNASNTVALVNGNGKITFTPPQGQYWIPRLIRVGITYPGVPFYPNNYEQYFCTLYHGGSGDIGVDAFIDGTAHGAGDVTTILNGTLILTGEFLTVDWNILDFGSESSADPTGVAFVQILGLTADSITEATNVIATAVPGPGFSSPLPTTMHTPQAASDSLLAIFNNPGQNNSVTLIAANPIYVYNVGILTGGVLVNGSGYLHSLGGPASFKFSYYNPGSAGLAVPVQWNYNGMRLSNPNLGGIEFIQDGNAAANGVAYAINIAYRAMAI